MCNIHLPLSLKVGCPSSGIGCEVALGFIFLCVGLMASFVVLRFSPVSFSCFSVVVRCVSAAGGVFA
jgi:hypothetical protein